MAKLRVTAILIATSIVIASCGTNPNEPRNGNWNFTLQKIWEIDSAGNDSLARPGELRVGEEGTVYVHDFVNGISYIFDRNGQFIGTFGAKGDAPGEVSWYINCFTTDGGVVIGAPDKLHFYTGRGEFTKAVPNDLFSRFPLDFINEYEFFLAPGALPDAPNGHAVITHVNLQSGEEKTFDEFLLGEKSEGTGGAVIVGLTPQLKMGHDPSTGRMYYGRNDEYSIYVADMDGNRIKTFGIERQKTPITEAEKRAHFEHLGVPQEQIDGIIGRLPGELGYFHRIQIVDGLVYVFLVSGIGGNPTGQQIDIFTPEGDYLYRGQITLPAGLHILGSVENLQLRDNYLYVVQEDDAGRKSIAKYRMTMPTEGAGPPE